MEFPKYIFVTDDPNTEKDQGEDFLAWKKEADAIEDDGPTIVARYQLVGQRKLKKIIEEA